MDYTACPRCGKRIEIGGVFITKCIGNPIVACPYCKKQMANNNIYDWWVVPIESRLNYSLFANGRSYIHLFFLIVPFSFLESNIVIGLILYLLFEAIACITMYFLVHWFNEHEINKSYIRSQDAAHIDLLASSSYDKLDQKYYQEYLFRHAASKTNVNPNPLAPEIIPKTQESTNTILRSDSANDKDRLIILAETKVQHPMRTQEDFGESTKLQLDLGRWKNRKKSDWDIGIEYERYIGYLLECEGFRVHYSGAILGLNDGGRDLIAIKNNKALVIQCKRWSKEKVIHEKHIHQLHGSTAVLSAKNPNTTYKAVFITTASLSDTAKKDAEACNITFVEQFPMSDYPLIKCNSNMKGQKIYHLPSDPQYDMIIISKNKESCYAWTIQEAEEMGFRHTYQGRATLQRKQKTDTPVKIPKVLYTKEKPAKLSASPIATPVTPKVTERRSSLIKNMEYKNNALYLTFNTGSVYCYYNVPESVYKEMLSAPSMGRFYNERIKDKYPYS